jgi:hypothetical protein
MIYTIDYVALGFQPAGFHLVSILWHAAAVVAFFFFACELLAFFNFEPRRLQRIVLVSALVWAIHDVRLSARPSVL